jgi:hypothetical protein
MKTNPIQPVSVVVKSFLLTFMLMISCMPLLHSQQFLKLKDGNQYMVNIVYQTKDTFKFQLLSDTEVTQTLLMDQVDSIGPKSLFDNPAWDTTSNLSENRTYKHFKHSMVFGIVLAGSGAGLLIGGIAIVASAQPVNEEGPFTGLDVVAKNTGLFVACIGGGLTLAGIILAATGSSRMKEIKQKLNGFSFDVKYTPQMRGFSLVYRF